MRGVGCTAAAVSLEDSVYLDEFPSTDRRGWRWWEIPSLVNGCNHRSRSMTSILTLLQFLTPLRFTHSIMHGWATGGLTGTIHSRAGEGLYERLSLRGVQRRSNLQWRCVGDCYGLSPSQRHVL